MRRQPARQTGHRGGCLRALNQRAHDSAAEVEQQKWPTTQRFFHSAAEHVNHPAIEEYVQKAGVHELERQQLPDVTMLQTSETQGQVIAAAHPPHGVTVIGALNNEGEDI